MCLSLALKQENTKLFICVHPYSLFKITIGGERENITLRPLPQAGHKGEKAAFSCTQWSPVPQVH